MSRVIRVVVLVALVGLAAFLADLGAAPARDDSATSVPPAEHVHDPAVGTEHRHDVDPVSATLLVIDGLVALAIVLLLATRRRGAKPVAWRLPASVRDPAVDAPEGNRDDAPPHR